MFICLIVLLYVYCLCVSFFFFKQKTAYEMRISDWSSDVCSSDLQVQASAILGDPLVGSVACRGTGGVHGRDLQLQLARKPPVVAVEEGDVPAARDFQGVVARCRHAEVAFVPEQAHARVRSEEHTSELQSLMRISYAVFCLKKKKKKTDA